MNYLNILRWFCKVNGVKLIVGSFDGIELKTRTSLYELAALRLLIATLCIAHLN